VIPKFSPVQSEDRVVNQLQDRVAKTLNLVASQVILDSNILKSVALAVGDNAIQHGLGRPLVGWFLVRVRAGTVIFDKQDTNGSPGATLILNSSGTNNVDIYVF
jgi:hypothetical protein